MISYRDYGYRMIGDSASASRAEYVRRRYLGAAAPTLNLTAANYQTPGGTFQGETYVPAAAPAVRAPRTINLHLGPVTPPTPAPVLPAAVPTTRNIPLHLAPVVVASPQSVPTTTDTFSAPPDVTTVDATPADCPACPSCTGTALATGAGVALLMLGVGVATNMVKFKSMKPRRNPRRKRR